MDLNLSQSSTRIPMLTNYKKLKVMSGETNELLVPDEIVMNKIYYIRGMKVMVDRDLAELYEVQPSNLNKAVGRNLKRFPDEDLCSN